MSKEAVGAQHSHETEAWAKACFLKDLYQFMESRDQSIERIPQLGFKELDLYLLYKIVQKFGGFDQVTAKKKWKQVYNMLGADPRSTSAATSTRRHYEKLLLPYDRCLAQRTPPPSQKRPHHHSPSVQEEQSLRSHKRSAPYPLPNPTHTQRSPDTSTDYSARITPRTTDNLTHGDPPSYQSVYPSIPPQQTDSQPQVHPQVCPLLHSQSPQELRSLAQPAVIDRSKKTDTSSGSEEPLNLSCQRGGRHPVSQRQPSLTPPTDKKVPKFLNRVSSLYQDSCLREEDVYRLPGNQSTRGPKHSELECESISVQEETVIDLTSSSDISLPSPPPNKNYLYPQPPLKSTCGPPDVTVNRIPEWKYSLYTGQKEGPFKLTHPPSDPAAISTGQMQPEFLQIADKDRYRVPAVGMETVGVVTSSGQQWGLSHLDRRSLFRRYVHWNDAVKGEESLHLAHRGSPCEKWQGKEPVSGCLGNAHWPNPWGRESKVQKPSPVGWLEARELQRGRRFPGAWPASSAWCPTGPAMYEQEAFQSTLEPSVSLDLCNGIPATALETSEVPKADGSPSLLIRLTPAEYWSLRQLISGSF